jgi:predicted nucleotidyltransferase
MATHTLSSLLFGGYRGRVLGLLLLQPEQSFHVREIARLTGTAVGTLHKELSKLAAAGLLLRREVGNQVLYAANMACPIFPELQGLLRKTSGLADILRDSLAPLAGQISVALVFGSIARGEERSGSDVDVLVVGDVPFVDVVKALHPAQAILQREINPVVYSLAEFRRKWAAGEAFLRGIADHAKIFLMGSEDDFGKLAGDSSFGGASTNA